MAKTSGLGSSLIVGVYDISGDIGALSSIESRRATLDVSSILTSATERITALKDGSISFSSFWNTAADQAHLALSPQPRTDIQVTYLHGSTVGEAAASMIAKQVNHQVARGQDGSLVAETQAEANGYGLEITGGDGSDGLLTTGAQSFATGTVSGTSIDYGSTSTLFGAAAYLHVISVASGTATFAVQDSANNTDFLDVTGLIFTGATGATTERLQTGVTATIRRYVRIQGTGVHGAAVIVCNFVRYLTNPSL